MTTVPNIQGGFSDLGSAVTDLFGAKAQRAMAGGYRKAAKITGETMGLQEKANEIREKQAEREILRTIGGQQADVAGAGFAASGSALDLLRDSQAQGALTMDILQTQGDMDINTLRAQQSMYTAQADAAEQQAKGGVISAAIKAVSAIGKFVIPAPV